MAVLPAFNIIERPRLAQYASLHLILDLLESTESVATILPGDHDMVRAGEAKPVPAAGATGDGNAHLILRRRSRGA